MADVSKADAPSVADAEELAHVLRLRIQRFDLHSGDWLREIRLCNEFGVGRSTVRRALRTLSDDGLIEIVEHRGARVRATSVEEVFDLYEVRAALYGLAVRFACLRGSDAAILDILADIDQLLADSTEGKAAEQLIESSEAIFTQMAQFASEDARRMIDAIRRKTRFHYSYAALALNADASRPFEHWRRVRVALAERDAAVASQAARDILYFMQGEVARIMLSHGTRVREDGPLPAPVITIPAPRRITNSRRTG